MLFYGLTIPISTQLSDYLYPQMSDLIVNLAPYIFLLMYPIILYPSYSLMSKFGYITTLKISCASMIVGGVLRSITKTSFIPIIISNIFLGSSRAMIIICQQDFVNDWYRRSER